MSSYSLSGTEGSPTLVEMPFSTTWAEGRSQSGQDDKFREWVNRLLRDLGVTKLSLEELSVETPETPLGKVSATIKTNVSKQQVIRR